MPSPTGPRGSSTVASWKIFERLTARTKFLIDSDVTRESLTRPKALVPREEFNTTSPGANNKYSASRISNKSKVPSGISQSCTSLLGARWRLNMAPS